MANTSCSIRPSQNAGIAIAADVVAEIARSTGAAGPDRGDDAGRQRRRQRQQQRRGEQLERRRQPLDHAVQHRAAVAEAVAPVAAGEGGQPAHVLDPDRAVEAEGAAQPVEVFRPDAGIRQVDLERPAGHELQQAEGDGRHDQQQRHRLERAAPGQAEEPRYSSVHVWTFQNGPVLVGLPVKPFSRAGTASSLLTP